jgi:hypothetical protein
VIDSDQLIHQASDEEQRDFSTKIEKIRDDELKDASDYLGAGVPDGAAWQDYRDAFLAYSWRDVTRAIEHATGGAHYEDL